MTTPDPTLVDRALTEERAAWAEVAAARNRLADDLAAAQTTIRDLRAQLEALTPKRVLWGYAHTGNTLVEGRETAAGHPIPLRQYYEPGQEVKAIAACTINAVSGRLTWVSFKAPVSWVDAAAGKADAWFSQLLTQLSTVPGPVWLTIHHEPEGDQPNIADFWAMTKRFAAVKRPANVKFGPIVIAWNQLHGPQKGTMPVKWEHGDFMGWDVYCRAGTKSNPSAKYWDLGPEYLTKLSALATAAGVPYAVGEFGISDDAWRTIPAAAGWLTRAHQAAIDTGNCAGLFYFDSTLNSTQNLSNNDTAWALRGGKLDDWMTVAKTA